MSSSSTSQKQSKLVEAASALVTRVAGIQLGPKQAAMVQARLSKRMLDLRMSPEQYLEHLTRNAEKESPILVSLLTTHHTFFFREFAHFEFLSSAGLRTLTEKVRAQGRTKLRIWSAACSWGHEVYSLSMLMANRLKEVAPDFSYEILGSDVDPDSVAISRNGVYKWDEVKEIPSHFMGSHWARGTGQIAAFVKAKKSIKDPCRFEVINLTELHRQAQPARYDLVFCRNVLIYFNQEQIREIARELLRRLEPHGYLFLGISESLMGMDFPLDYAGPSIYQLKQSKTDPAAKARSRTVAVSKTPAPVASFQDPIRLLCVDDSPVILSLLKKIFSADPGFEVVATAKNGLEAAEMMKKHKIDAVTLDIHMPGQTGLEYLQKNFGPKHPPVIMVTSVSREDAELGIKCLESGARDFVEKPALNNIDQKGEELRMKVRCAVAEGNSSPQGMVDVARSFARPAVILNPERKLRIWVCGLSDRERLQSLLRETKGSQPATLILIHEGGNVVSGLLPGLSSACPEKLAIWDGKAISKSGFYLADFDQFASEVGKLIQARRTSLLVLGDVTRENSKKMMSWIPTSGESRFQLLIEEGPSFSKSHQELEHRASEIIPVTSFVHTSDVFLSRDI